MSTDFAAKWAYKTADGADALYAFGWVVTVESVDDGEASAAIPALALGIDGDADAPGTLEARTITKAFEAVQASLTKTVTPAVAAFAVALEGVVKYLTDKGLLKGPEDDVDVKRNRQTVEQMQAASAEILAKGPMTPEDAAEYGALQDQIAKSELRNTSTEDLQKQKNAIYGKGGVVSDADAAEADRITAEIKRKENPDVGATAPGLLSQKDFVEEYVNAGAEGQNLTLAKLRANMFANALQGNGEMMPEWVFKTMGETDEEHAARDHYKGSMAESRALPGIGELPGDQAGKVANQHADRVEVHVTIDTKGQASITGTSGPSVTAGPGT
jgi:hypothetical protein